jgi:carbonic anhydrase
MVAGDVLERLKLGNDRFMRGETRTDYSSSHRQAVAEQPHPSVVIVGCSDSRVPVETVFDVGIGDAWVVRTAGHVLSEAGLASVRFGVETWGIPLVVVVGHEDCLAVRAALEGFAPAWLRPITEYIEADPAQLGTSGEDESALVRAVDTHVTASVAALTTYLKGLPLPDAATPQVVGCTYHPTTGEVRWLT